MKSFPTLLIFALAALAQSVHAETIQLTSYIKTARTVHAVINGQSGTFLFDTGGGLSVLTPAFAAKISCRPWGQLTGHQMSGKRLDAQRCNDVVVRFGDLESNMDGIGVFDIQKLLPPDAPQIDGSLALDLFNDKVVMFSQSRNVLAVLDTVPASLQRCASIPVHVVREAEGFALTVSLPVRTPDGTAWFEMDSGNVSPFTLVNRIIAASLGMRAVVRAEQTSVLTLGDGKIVSLKTLVDDLVIDGNLGTNFLAGHDVAVDIKARRAWIMPVPKSDGASASCVWTDA